MTQPKYNLKSHSGLNNYLAQLDNQMEQIVRCRLTVSPRSRANMYAEFLNLWFRFEDKMLTPDSPKLLEYLKNQEHEIIEVLRKWD